MRKLFFLSILCLLWVGWSCTEEAETPIIVTTEDALFVGGDKIRISGRLITNREISASDHGFIISESESFSSPTTISLGTKESPGRFIGETSGLKISQTYWVKAFSIVGGEELSGQAVRIQMLTPQIEGFSPRFAKAGDNVVLSGRNIPEGSKVFFGTKEAQILNNQFESRITVKVPVAEGSAVVPVRVEVQGNSFTFSEQFEYQSGKYTKVSEFPESFRVYNTVAFHNAAGFHVGLGLVRLGGNYTKFQRFNLLSGTWSEVAFSGNPRSYAFATPNYLGGGALEIDRQIDRLENSFYKIEGSTFSRLADLPFISVEQVVVELNGFLYAIGGTFDTSTIVWRFSPGANSWTQLPSAPIDISSRNPYFQYQGKLYVASSQGEIFEFNPNGNTWVKKATYPGSLGQGFGIAQVVGNKAYVGLYRRTQDLWELDLNTFTWKIKNSIPGLPQSMNLGHFEINGSIYFLRGPEISVFGDLPLELYKFEPNAL
ncbi:MAG: IPT/TIG domain-containing protein [Cyclobacteriaceae bacterium]|nr:IPT/TIG domain-containing protein [Cyclobacteriaceae bacterium]MDX5467883.1 IPT/TIG domain-containing protein [Cyclobacteriaceae bacterium]